MNRRDFLTTTASVGIGLGMASLGGCTRRTAAKPATSAKCDDAATGSGTRPADLVKGAPNAKKPNWRLGCQAWSFNRFTFFEAIDKTASLGLYCIEAFPDQQINKTQSAKVGVDMTPAQRKEILNKLADSRVKMVNFGVGGYDRRHFEFAKQMGIETLVAEPAENDLDAIEKLCGEYEINLAIHNHPRPSPYWNPDKVLKACAGRSRRIGACADTGHWPRSGLKPVDCLRKLAGRIVSLHFKDINKMALDAHDVPWGSGVCNVAEMLAELYRQRLDAVFSIEYEYNWENSLPDIAKCIAYFKTTEINLAAMETNMPASASLDMLAPVEELPSGAAQTETIPKGKKP